MLQSYSAQINGSQLVWLDVVPQLSAHQRVLVVVEEAPAETSNNTTPSRQNYSLSDLAGRLQWRGDAVGNQRAQRDAW